VACLAYLLYQRNNGKGLFGYVAVLPYSSSTFKESGEIGPGDLNKDTMDLELELWYLTSTANCMEVTLLAGTPTLVGMNSTHTGGLPWRRYLAVLGCSLDPRSYHVVDRVFSDGEFHASQGLNSVRGVRRERKANA